MRVYVLVFSILILGSARHSAFGQFGKLKDKLKEKADQLLEADPSEFLNKEPEEVLQQQLKKKTAAERAALDTSSFIYTIAFLDKSESFENQQKLEKFIKAADFLLAEEEVSPRQEAVSLYELGRFNYLKRQYRVAEFNLIAARGAFEFLELLADPVYMKTLGALSALYNDMGRYDLAYEMIDLAVQGWQTYYGTQSKGYMAAAHNKSIIMMNQGRFASAEKQLLMLQTRIAAQEGEQSMPHAIVNNNLAILNLKLGRKKAAADFSDRCIMLADAALKEKSGTYIQLLTNQALIYQHNQAYDEAEEIYVKAKTLQENRLKLNRTSDPDYAQLLSNMAALYMYKAELDIAEQYLDEALQIFIQKYGESFPAVAAAQNDRGVLYRIKGQWEEALNAHQAAYESRITLLGEAHPSTINSLYGMAVSEWYLGQGQVARDHMEQVLDQSLVFVNKFFASMSEVEKTSYWDELKPYFQTYFNFTATADDPEAYAEKALYYRTATKGILLSSSTKLKSEILASGDQELIALYEQWVDQKKTLAVYYSLSQEEIASQNINVDSLESSVNTTERTLSDQSGLFTSSISVTNGIQSSDVKAALSADEAVVELIQYPGLNGVLTNENGYLALVIRKDQPVKMVDLGIGAALDGKPFSAYKNLIRLKVPDNRSYNSFWKEIDAYLNGINRLYVSADGVYHQVNIATFRLPDETYVIDKYEVKMIGNIKQVLAQKQSSQGNIGDAFLLGFPAYGTEQVAALPGTDVEVNAISAILQDAGVTHALKREQEASETALKTAGNPSILHIATHGFFLEDVGNASGSVFGVKIDQASNNPLLRAGLLLAGVDGTGSSGDGFEANDNGVLNAYEAMNIELSETQLVVLSACETGQGDVKSGEGVYGLQRAFKLAGAEQLMMSLWKVDDNATKELMIAYYTNWLKKDQAPAVAFRNAQRSVRESYPQPYYWGAFVMVE